MKPAPGIAFIIEDQKDEATASGILLQHKSKSRGSIGTIHAINGRSCCPHCNGAFDREDVGEGDRVIYSSFVAEHIEYKEPGMREGRLFSVPVDAILAKITA